MLGGSRGERTSVWMNDNTADLELNGSSSEELEQVSRSHDLLSKKQIPKPRHAAFGDQLTDSPTRGILGLSVTGLQEETDDSTNRR